MLHKFLLGMYLVTDGARIPILSGWLWLRAKPHDILLSFWKGCGLVLILELRFDT